jgi:hypothetical protein
VIFGDLSRLDLEQPDERRLALLRDRNETAIGRPLLRRGSLLHDPQLTSAPRRTRQLARLSRLSRPRSSSRTRENATRMPEDNGRGRSSEAHRYSAAATQALEMLDWRIGFRVGIR